MATRCRYRRGRKKERIRFLIIREEDCCHFKFDIISCYGNQHGDFGKQTEQD